MKQQYVVGFAFLQIISFLVESSWGVLFGKLWYWLFAVKKKRKIPYLEKFGNDDLNDYVDDSL